MSCPQRSLQMGCPQVCATATLQCSFGAAPAMLNVLPVHVDVQLGGGDQDCRAGADADVDSLIFLIPMIPLIPSPQPSPGGRGGRPRCLAWYVDLNDRIDYGFMAVLRRCRRGDYGFTAVFASWRSSVMDAQRIFHVGVIHQYPTVSPLSLRERARVRGSQACCGSIQR